MATRSRYRSFMAKEKLRIIEEAENIENCAAGRKYDVSESCIRDWCRTEKNSNRRAFRGQEVKKGCAITWTIKDNTDAQLLVK